MFDVLFGWRKASKCKKVIKLAQCRLKLLKNKRQVIVKQLRQDTAHLIKTGYQNIAYNRAQQLIQDETVLAAYELLDRFCEFILNNFSYIRRRKDFPDDVNEAVSSLIYASARCGDLPELRVIRKLFEDRYGKKFTSAAVELFPGNLVNLQVMETLAMKSVSDEMKHRTVSEIAEDYCLKKPEVLALEYYPEWQHQEPVKESSEDKVLAKDVQIADAVIGAEIILVDSSPSRTKLLTEPSSTSASDVSFRVQRALPTVLESKLDNKAEKVENSFGADSQRMSSPGTEETKRIVIEANTREAETGLESKEERSIRASSSESLPKVWEETVVYLDDIEEYQSSSAKEVDSQDQRFFKFKSSRISRRVNFRNSCDRSYWESNEWWTENSSSKDSQRSCIVSRKRSSRRLVYPENQSMKDIECASYYDQPHKSTFNRKHRSYHRRKQQNKMLVQEGDQERSSYESEKRPKQFCSRKIAINPLTSNSRCCCNHKSPCHFSTDEDNDEYEVRSPKQKNLVSRHCRDQQFLMAESNKETKLASMPPKPGSRSYDNGAPAHDIFTNPDPQIQKQNKGSKAAAKEFGLQGGHASFSSCGTRNDAAVSPYLRTLTMPPERSKDGSKDDFQRSNSCPVKYPNHVHPKLPDYDDLTARFIALKKEKMLNKLHCIKQKPLQECKVVFNL